MWPEIIFYDEDLSSHRTPLEFSVFSAFFSESKPKASDKHTQALNLFRV